jgi:hypothetical protein
MPKLRAIDISDSAAGLRKVTYVDTDMLHGA